jgi:hypothetical protein
MSECSRCAEIGSLAETLLRERDEAIAERDEARAEVERLTAAHAALAEILGLWHQWATLAEAEKEEGDALRGD